MIPDYITSISSFITNTNSIVDIVITMNKKIIKSIVI